MPKDLTLEINPSHPTIINLNTLRKSEPDFAKSMSLLFLDQVCQSSNIPYDMRQGQDRKQMMIEQYLDESLGVNNAQSGASRRVEEATFEPVKDDDDEGESILKQAQAIRSESNKMDSKITAEYKVTGKEGKGDIPK